MKNRIIQLYKESRRGLFISATALAIVCLICAYGFWQARAQVKGLTVKVSELQEALKNSSDSLARVQKEKDDLMNNLNIAAAKNANFASQLDSVNNQVESLQRLTKTDPELLQKYSKIYFLNENYKPSGLEPIDTKFLFNKDKPIQIHDRVWPFLQKLLNDSAAAGLHLEIISGYRSFGTQAALKSSYKVTYGAGTANAFSADQGYSEHQLGTTIDFTTPKIGSSFFGFDKSDEFNWLKNNAYKYGFILSYPANNNYYVYEPWHWRFVGLDLALKLHNENKNFYDLDQRDISPFLMNIFNSLVSSQ